jgi:hypothetical protein
MNEELRIRKRRRRRLRLKNYELRMGEFGKVGECDERGGSGGNEEQGTKNQQQRTRNQQQRTNLFVKFDFK